jgi:hypothetical protein
MLDPPLIPDLITHQGKMVVIRMDDNELITAQVLQVDARRWEAVVDVVGTTGLRQGNDKHAFVLPIDRMLSVAAAPPTVQPRHPVPDPDTCRTKRCPSFARILMLAVSTLLLIPGSAICFALLSDHAYGMQMASLFTLTIAVNLFTFGGSSRFGGRPFLYTCPAVRKQLLRLVRRHLFFMAAIFALETVAFWIRTSLPSSWLHANGRNIPPFALTLMVLCTGFGLIELFGNQSILERAHLEFV